ncbi:P-loop containing nucleoside triphosphate hydrolase protein, partial [Trichophaea hybrida]
AQKKCFMVQFERDPYFVGRQDIIKEIDERLKLRPHRVALAGIGGVGKSRIAIEYCYRYKDNHPEARVFWVHASNIARFEQAYKDIATELDLPGLDDPNTDILRLVSKWFAGDCNGPWLCILDNADDMDILFGSGHDPSSPQDAQQQTPLLSSFLPRSSNGLTIVTTRDNRVGQKLSNNGKPIPVLPFAMADAESLLRPKLSSDDKWCEPQAIELLGALDCLPLAITQAAAFINENDIDTAKYLELLQASDLDATHLLEEDLFDPGRDRDIRNSVFQTWKLSFNQIAKQ